MRQWHLDHFGGRPTTINALVNMHRMGGTSDRCSATLNEVGPGAVGAAPGRGQHLCGGAVMAKPTPHVGDESLGRRLSRRRGLSVVERLWPFIGPDRSGCWEWLGHIDSRGYPRCTHEGKNRGAHRVLYELLVEPVPGDLSLDHLCGNPGCVNPAHLEPVPLGVNVLRGGNPAADNARKTHCPQGHEYNEANTRITPDGARACRVCARERERLKRRGEWRR